MKSIVLLSALMLIGCNETVPVPPEVTSHAAELCESMDGAKNIRVRSWYKNPKSYDNKMVSQIHVTCKRHNASVSRTFEWKW